jgi:hypothetical protein
MEKRARSSTATAALHTFFNPFASESETLPLGRTPTTRNLNRAAALVLGWGAASVGLRTLINYAQTTKDQDRRGKLKAYINAKYPIISPAVGEEEALSELGIENVDKKASLEKTAIEWVQPGWAIGAAAVLAGLYAGNRLADRLFDVRKKEQQTTEIDEQRKALDKFMYEEYLRTRGLSEAVEKQAKAAKKPSGSSKGKVDVPDSPTFTQGALIAAAALASFYVANKLGRYAGRQAARKVREPQGVEEFIPNEGISNDWTPVLGLFGQGEKQAAGPKTDVPGIRGSVRQAIETGSKGYWLWVAAVFAVGYGMGKKYADYYDPARRRTKQLEEEVKRMAIVEEPPILISPEDFPTASALMRKKPEKKRSAVLGMRSGQANPLPLVDEKDPYAAQLGMHPGEAVPSEEQDPYGALLR